MVALDLTPISLLWLAYAVAALGLVVLVLRARPITAGNVVLVALLLQQAWSTVASVVRLTTTDPDLAWQATQWNIPAWLLWAPLVFLAGPLLLGRAPHARGARMLGIGAAVPGLVLALGSIAIPSMVLREDLSGLTDVAAASLLSVFLGFAFTVAVLAREALTTPLPVRRSQFALLAAAFSVEGAFHAAQSTAKIAFGLEFHGALGTVWYEAVLSYLPLLVFAGIAAWAARLSWRHPEAEGRYWARVLLGFIAAACITGFAAAPLTVANEFTEPAGAFHAIWDLAGLVLIVYAGMRYQLFALERQAKRSVSITASWAMIFVTWTSVQEFGEGVVASISLFPNLGDYKGLLAAVVVSAVAIPIASGGQKLATRLFPRVEALDYERQRKLAIYAAALEGAFADGVETPSEAASLSRLRKALGLTDQDHATMEARVRERLAAASQASPKGAPAA